MINLIPHQVYKESISGGALSFAGAKIILKIYYPRERATQRGLFYANGYNFKMGDNEESRDLKKWLEKLLYR